MNTRTRTTLILFCLSLLGAVGVAWVSAPRFDEIVKIALGSDRVLLGRDGQILQTLRTDFSKRRLAWQPLAGFPETMQNAVTEAEDQRFFHHFGVDLRGLARAISANLRGRRVQGASTITMQVTDLIQEDVLLRNQTIRKGSIPHKLAQVWRAFALELRWSKAEILEAYLNLIHLRGEFQGIPAVSYGYLGRDPLTLSESEALVIASMISSPNQKLELLSTRACALLRQVSQRRAVQQPGCEGINAAAQSFFETKPSLPTNLGTAPHLARRLFQENRAGGAPASILKSSIDTRLQKDVAAILEKSMQRLRDQNVRDSAAIVIDNATGEVLAYVGAVSTSESPHVDGIQAYRQAGSSLKPFLYGEAIDMKLLTSASILLDEPTAISWGSDVYRPTNYDKHFNGPVSVREALGSSLNVPAVKTVTIIGLHRAYDTLQSVHFTGLKPPDFYGVSMALGAVEVRLEDLANAYRIFANHGEWTPFRFVPAAFVPDAKATAPQRVYSPEASYIIASILSDPNARSIGFGWDSPLETPFWTAVKTGTSKDYRDNWCVGFSDRYTVAVWAGNFNSEAMNKVSGVSGVGPSWYEIMVRLHGNNQSAPPAMPAGVVAKQIRHQWSSGERTEFFIKGTEPASTLIEPALEKQAQFVFPADGSVLIKDPHMDQAHVALFIRYKGTVPAKSQLLLDDQSLGEAVSPFKLTDFSTGSHELSLKSPSGEKLTSVRFKVRGAN